MTFKSDLSQPLMLYAYYTSRPQPEPEKHQNKSLEDHVTHLFKGLN